MRTSVLIVLALTITYVAATHSKAKAAAKQSGSYMGCFVDNGNRVLPDNFQSSGSMTVELCQSLCQGYAYYGVEYGSQCFCGDDLPTQTSSDCNYQCAGNSQEICGGFWAISVYSGSNSNSNYQNLGCFVDNGNRVLPDNFQSSGSMTVELCANLCQGYAYFGVEYGSQCFCGNDAPTLQSSDCNYQCAGNSQETCGGFWAINVYSYGSASSKSKNCFVDVPSRVLPDDFISDDGMTIEKCAGLCKGYSYFGVEYGSQCFCGNSKPSLQSSNDCNYPCAGNSQEICGGYWAINIWRYEYGKSVGCFVDNGNRVLPNNFQSSDSMTVAMCQSLCQDYTYFGVEYGTQCFCGNDLPTQQSSDCNYQCAGNSKETCGGFWAINVYQNS